MNFPFWTPGEPLLLDGAMGTVLQQRGLPPGGQPELLNLSDPKLIFGVHRDYADAGSRVVYANTFGANAHKLR
ncbi:MAG: homocysteine S-methyltransferase family protein, partial [Oscillibacter sp.]|nr:homocysteine S-methyltransferase family protein [Oscillibacter sp.]